ncbi:hypothetical protein ACV229_10550 [Burkholderia sp. MR1-5-21]
MTAAFLVRPGSDLAVSRAVGAHIAAPGADMTVMANANKLIRILLDVYPTRSWVCISAARWRAWWR